MWCDVMWCDVTWRDVMRCDVMWRDVTWCDVMWSLWCDVTWRDVRWHDVIWCGKVWYNTKILKYLKTIIESGVTHNSKLQPSHMCMSQLRFLAMAPKFVLQYLTAAAKLGRGGGRSVPGAGQLTVRAHFGGKDRSDYLQFLVLGFFNQNRIYDRYSQFRGQQSVVDSTRFVGKPKGSAMFFYYLLILTIF